MRASHRRKRGKADVLSDHVAGSRYERWAAPFPVTPKSILGIRFMHHALTWIFLIFLTIDIDLVMRGHRSRGHGFVDLQRGALGAWEPAVRR
jgi:Ni,Fe-hydrogenase I cytochrome b subunit